MAIKLGDSMNLEQRQKVASLLAAERLLYLATSGARGPTITMQAYAETSELAVITIMRSNTARFQDIHYHAEVSCLIDDRDKRNIEGFQIRRLSIWGTAQVLHRDTPAWDDHKRIFLAKNPFEKPFFDDAELRLVRIRPRSVKYADGIRDVFVADL